MKLIALPLLLVALAVAPGCKKKPEAEPAAPAEKAAAVSVDSQPAPAEVAANTSPAPGSPPAEAPAAQEPAEAITDKLPTAPPETPLTAPVNKELTSALHLYLMDNRKLPNDFATLVKERYLREAPKPPPGKKFAFDRRRGQVVIID